MKGPRMPEKKPEQPSVLDELADDAVPDLDEYPEGAPELQPDLGLRPRSRRAEFKRKYAEVAERMKATQEMRRELAKAEDKDDQAPKLRLWAELDDLYQAIDELLALVARDVEAYAHWSDEVTDDDLMATFIVYQKRSQVGEASSSAT